MQNPERTQISKLTQEVIDNLNSIISTEIIEFVVKNLPIKTAPRPRWLHFGEFYQMLKEEIIHMLHKLSQKIEHRLKKKKSLNKMLRLNSASYKKDSAS